MRQCRIASTPRIGGLFHRDVTDLGAVRGVPARIGARSSLVTTAPTYRSMRRRRPPCDFDVISNKIASGYPPSASDSLPSYSRPTRPRPSDQRLPVLDEDYLILSTIHSAKGRGNGSRSSSSTSVGPAAFRRPRHWYSAEIRGGSLRLLSVRYPRQGLSHRMVPQRSSHARHNPRADRHLYASLTTASSQMAFSGLFDMTSWPRLRPASSANGGSKSCA